MSSILKALKKLESEAPVRTEDAAPALHRAMSVRRTFQRRLRKSQLIRHISLALAGVLVLTAGIWVYVNRRNLPVVKQIYPGGEIVYQMTPPSKNAAESLPAPKPAISPAPRPVSKHEPPSVPVEPEVLLETRPKKQPTTPTPDPKPALKPEPEPKTAPKPVVPKTAATSKPEVRSPSSAKNSPQPLAKTVGSDESSQKTKPAPRVRVMDLTVEPPSPGPFADAIQRTDPRYHIQALVWSKDPAGRMAMVNGAIVKTGGQVGDARIVHIGENFLIFQENGDRWRHPFRVQ